MAIKVSGTTVIDDSRTLLPQDGSAATPSITFSNDINTGLYRVTTDEMGVATNGTLVASFKTNAIESLQRILLPVGSAGTPSLSFSDDLDSGMYRSDEDTISFAVGGNTLLGVSVTGITAPFTGGGDLSNIYAARAWVNFDAGSGGVNKTIIGSANVSNVSETSTGNYVVNLTNSMPDNNYACVGSCDIGVGATVSVVCNVYPINSSSFRVRTFYTDSGKTYTYEPDSVSAVLFR